MRLVYDTGGAFHRSTKGGEATCAPGKAYKPRRPKKGEIRARRLYPCRVCYAPKRRRSGPSPKARAKLAEHVGRMSVLRPLVFARAGYRCEVRSEGCSGRAEHAHHRYPVDTLEALVATCANCHTDAPAAIHRERGWARSVGLLLSRHGPPPSECWTRAEITP